MENRPCVLIVEDGNEYLENLSNFVEGYCYLQAHNFKEALGIIQSRKVDLVYLDMRFDRIANSALVGDHAKTTMEHNGDPVRAWKFLQNNQGLFILNELNKHNLGTMPVILAYDFSRHQKRYEHLKKTYPNLRWVSDAVTPREISSLIDELTSSAV